jgi:hypothetical protein
MPTQQLGSRRPSPNSPSPSDCGAIAAHLAHFPSTQQDRATYKEIASRLGYGFEANAHRAVQQAYDALPEALNSAQLRKIQNLRLDAIWRMAYLAARDGNVPAMRVLLEVCRRQAWLNGLDQPQTLHIGSPGDTAPQEHMPTLREVLPPELVADARAVREQALLLHRALPM